LCIGPDSRSLFNIWYATTCVMTFNKAASFIMHTKKQRVSNMRSKKMINLDWKRFSWLPVAILIVMFVVHERFTNYKAAVRPRTFLNARLDILFNTTTSKWRLTTSWTSTFHPLSRDAHLLLSSRNIFRFLPLRYDPLQLCLKTRPSVRAEPLALMKGSINWEWL